MYPKKACFGNEAKLKVSFQKHAFGKKHGKGMGS
jgi:hypothetical protein